MGDGWRRDLEYGRYVRFRQDGVPPLSPRQWRGLIEMWQQPRFGDFKAFALGSDRDRFYRGSGYLWARTAGEDVVAKCQGSGDERCRLYALGEEVVWGLDYQGLERVFAAYEAASRQREKAAIADLTRAIKEGEAGALAERGDRRLPLGDYPGALADYETLITLRPESASGWLKRASLYYRLERYDLALADFRTAAERAVGVERNDAVLWGAHAELFTGRREAALAAFETLIEYGSRDVKDAGRLGRGLARLLGGDVAGGLDDFRTIVSRNPTDAVVMEVVCRHLLLAALPAAALPYCEAANLLAAGDPRNLDARAFAYWQSGRRQEAEWDLAKAARIDPLAPGPLLRQEQFRILLAKLFLWRQGYDVGMIDSVLDDRGRQAIAAYRLANGFAPSAEADDEFLGHLTPLGLGSYRVEAVGLVLPAYRIAAECRGAAEGELAVITDAKGTRYRCNADGSSVRRLPPATQ
jgi:tetratricopeptide (TPR) repeat protein